ncbi:MAG: hypothetical protein JWR10_4618 [Rubritepida sp.]|nr:hypothetical protein [Rubritepida sp.]
MMTPILASLEKRSLESRATDEVRAAIVSRRFLPGRRLTEMQLAAELGVSRGTVRSALHTLLAEGLIAQRPYAAWEVVGLTAEDTWELYTLRAVLEGMGAELTAAALAGQRISADPLQVAFDALEQACQAGDIPAADEADLAFHKAVIASAGHGRLLGQYERVQAQMRMLIGITNDKPASCMRLVPQHRALLDVLLSGDAARAAEQFREHARIFGEETLRRLTTSAAA